ncbi:MAG: hypothetical protein ACOY9Y_06970 [Bacillota bacterium]
MTDKKDGIEDNLEREDKWNHQALADQYKNHDQREKFLLDILQRKTGMTADREKIPSGFRTMHPKILPPNKEE